MDNNKSILLILLIAFLVSIPFQPIDIEEVSSVPTIFFDHGTYSAEEQLMLELHNRARKDPLAEATRLGLDLQDGIITNLTTMPPLAMNRELCITTDLYSETMYNFSTLGHDVDGTTFLERATANNYTGQVVGENVAGSFNLNWLYPTLMEDSGWENYGEPMHREFILGIPYFNSEIGIGNYQGGYCDILYGKSSIVYLLGVVYNDTNNNSFYDVGEGIGDVTITPSHGDYYTVTGEAGGYSLPITVNGTITLNACSSINNLNITKEVAVSTTGDNIKIDFIANKTSIVTTTISTIETTATTTTETSTVISTLETTTTINTTETTTSVETTTYTNIVENRTSWIVLTTWITKVTWITEIKQTADFISLSIIALTMLFLVSKRRRK